MLLSLHGQTKDALSKTKIGNWEYDIVYPAFKCNMTDIQAAIGLVQLKRYPKLSQRRKEIIEKYSEGLKDLPVSYLTHYSDEKSSSGHLYLVRVNGQSESTRNEIISCMGEKGISTNVHYKPLPMLTAYKKIGFDIKNFPNAFSMYKNEITLPLHTLLTNDDVDYILTSFKECLKNVSGTSHE